jgi:hypothetical protein
VVSAANTTLDLRILERILLLDVLALLLIARLPSGNGPEEDVLGHGSRVGLRTCGLALFGTELGPLLALSDARVYDGFDRRLLDAACGFDLLAVFAERVGYDGFAAVFVLGDCLLGELERVFVVFFGPVGAAVGVCVSGLFEMKVYMGELTLLLETCWR